MTSNDELLRRVALDMAAWAGTFSLAVGQEALDRARAEAAGDPLGMVACASELAEIDGDAVARFLGLHARSRGLPPARHATSLAFQRYAHRVAGVAVAGWLDGGLLLDLRAEACQVLVREGTPTRVIVPAPELMPATGELGPDAESLVKAAVDGHLIPVARAMQACGGASLANLWGNTGAALAGACRQMSKRRPAAEVMDYAQALFGTRPELRRTGTFRVLRGPAGERVFFDRRSCCHWYAARDGKYCSWCSRLTRDQRSERFRDILANETT